MGNRFKKDKNIYNIGYHVIIVPKYRAKILIGNFKTIIEEALKEKAESIGIDLEKCEILPDHIHMFIKCTPKHTISKVIGELKGYSSYTIRRLYPKYTSKYKNFWSPSYYCETVGHISEEIIKKYIDNQWSKE